MSKLNIDQETVKSLFSDKNSDFLIPDYQRPYAWEEKECRTLWDDLFDFAFPDHDCDKFNKDEEYFLGPIVSFTNEEGKQEIIDGQQRLTTLLLLLRAFYSRYGQMQDDKAKKTARLIAQCIWKTDEFGDADKTALKITSEVASDDDKDVFLSILTDGDVSEDNHSHYANNYRFFQGMIERFQLQFADYFSYLPIRIMNNCILLPIEAESQDTALRIFSTLNDRGKPLSDADIFKAQFYKFFNSIGKKDEFIEKWKEFEALCNKIFHPKKGTPMDDAFARYMYYEKAVKGLRETSVESLRKFYEKDSYALLKSEETFNNIIDLTTFWRDVAYQDSEKFSEEVLKKLYVLNNAPNATWTSIVSVYYMTYRNSDGVLEQKAFSKFLSRVIGFIWAYSLTNPGVAALRTPIYAEICKLVKGQEVSFEGFRFDADHVKKAMNIYKFSIKYTRAMLTWWAFRNKDQVLLSFEKDFDIEHIYARNRQKHEHGLTNEENLESLGNKVLLEDRINIRAADYRFADKKKYYQEYSEVNGQKSGTQISEVREIAERYDDFVEKDIEQRHDLIIDSFIDYLGENGLLK